MDIQVVKRDELIEQLDKMKKVAKQCPRDMMFNVMIFFMGIDKNFGEIAKKFNIEEAEKRQKALENIQKNGDI